MINLLEIDNEIFEKELKVSFGKFIRRRRINLNISQKALSLKTGLHLSYISSIEKGERNVSIINVFKLANSLKCTVSDLFKDFEKELDSVFKSKIPK